MADREARFAEAARLAQLLVDITEQAKADFAATVAAFGLPVPVARAIVLLTTPAPMSDLAEQLACDRSYITNLADQMEERGLITRVAGKDRRVKLLALTDAGLAVRDQISEAVSTNNMILRRLTDAERRTLAPLLERLRGAPGPRAPHQGGGC
ncbi:MarR family transcriptional regulator [Dactylosporangium sp. NPDC005572]|uniref:MarR family winged helix-turn-helix transcriptional regulator n=1 Tax=Dactylosporangium sp. NPDC005572 TaxID=3156889 RepID=UPI0033AE38A9